MDKAKENLIYETEYLAVSQAYGYRVPGYVIVQSKIVPCLALVIVG